MNFFLVYLIFEHVISLDLPNSSNESYKMLQLNEARDEADGHRAQVMSLTQKSDHFVRNIAEAQSRLDKQISLNSELEKKQRKWGIVTVCSIDFVCICKKLYY